jgi:hypothetical protein
MMAGSPVTIRRGTVAAAMVIALVLLQLVVAGMVMAGARDQDLTQRRVETARAFYAAEAGMNMALREIILTTDFDGDGTAGTISDDGNPANDPTLSGAQVVVTQAAAGGVITLTSRGRCGLAVREIEALLE